MITYQLESWYTYRGEAMGLWKQHYNAVATDKSQMEMLPDDKFYEFLWAQGQLQVMTIRQAGKMIGYCLVVVRPHMHYSKVLCGFEDSYFILPESSPGMSLGVRYARLVKQSLVELASRGVKKVFFHSKAFAHMERIFTSQGFTQSDIIYSKWIGD